MGKFVRKLVELRSLKVGECFKTDRIGDKSIDKTFMVIRHVPPSKKFDFTWVILQDENGEESSCVSDAMVSQVSVEMFDAALADGDSGDAGKPLDKPYVPISTSLGSVQATTSDGLYSGDGAKPGSDSDKKEDELTEFYANSLGVPFTPRVKEAMTKMFQDPEPEDPEDPEEIIITEPCLPLLPLEPDPVDRGNDNRLQ